MNKIRTRIVHKHDTEANWNKATSFIPKIGEFIIYDVDENFSYSRIKIGDGTTTVGELPFFNEVINTLDISHKDTSLVLADIIDTYILQIDYENQLAFDVNETIFDVTTTTAKLGVAVLGLMRLGEE